MASSERQTVDLEPVRADGWLERLGAEIAQFEQLCDAVGKRFVAFSFIASVRITAIAYDPQSPASSTVDFAIDDGDPQQLSLSDFRERLGAVLLNAPTPSDVLSDEPSLDDIRAFIGRRYILLAPIFGISLLELHHGDEQPTSLTVELGGAREELGIENLREILHNAIRSEVARARPAAPFSIDFKKIPEAEQANREGDYDQTINLLGAWPGPLSMFLRTPQGQALGAAERNKVMQALGVLGDAYLHRGQPDWAEDILRLGIQFGQELAASAPLFGLLGRSRAESERPGEAIGFLRRALSLGGDDPQLLQLLASCFIERGRFVAAMACLDEAALIGADEAELEGLRGRVAKGLGEGYAAYRDFMSDDSDV